MKRYGEDKTTIGGKSKYLKWLVGSCILAIIGLAGLVTFTQTPQVAVFNYVFGQEEKLKVEDGRVNILLLGIAGGKHDGPNLTDTIMMASIDPETDQVDLISLPRDLWLDEHQAKVNALYQIGLKKGDGLNFAQQEIGHIFGVAIPYAIRVDFAGFIQAVDLVEGIDVEVAKTFDDYVYPLPGHENDLCSYQESEKDFSEEEAKAAGVEPGKLKVLLDKDGKVATSAAKPGQGIVYTDSQVIEYFPCRFDHLTFKQGLTHMDGETALKFVRSRHGTNGENSDFARSRRQQLVLQAFRSKVISWDTLSDLGKIASLLQTFGNSVETNIPQSHYLELVKLGQGLKLSQSYVIDSAGPDSLLVSPPSSEYGGAWVLVPRQRDFSVIHRYVHDLLHPEATSSTTTK